MDTISDILNTLKFSGYIYFTTNFSAPWGIRVPDYQNVARFHLVTAGQLWIQLIDHDEKMLLSAGDIIVIPHGASHILSDHPDSSVSELEEAIESSGYTGEGVFSYGGCDTLNRTQLICGHLEFDPRFEHALIQQLPELIVINNNEAMKTPWMSDALRFMIYEAQSQRMGNAAIVKRLSEIIFIHTIRIWSERTKQTSSFLNAVSDPHLGKGLHAFHNAPSKRWTLNELARESGLSRTVFAQRFREKVGVSAMQYITHWRAQQAQKLLIEGSQSIEQVAETIGYDSLAAFSRMFKKLFGIGPGAFRRNNKTKNNPDD